MATISGENLLDLKRRMDLLRGQRDKAQWEKEQVEKELLERFGLKTAAEAEGEAKKLQAQAESLEAEVEKKLAAIQDKYRELLEMAG